MTRRLPSLNALRAFEAAARHQSLTLASSELNVAQAAVSRHVRELEAWLGAKLFHRTGRGVALTEEGVALAADLTAAFDRLAAAVDRFKTPGQRRRLVVSSDVSFAALWLVPRLKTFLAAHPDIDLVIDPSPRLVDYAKGEADIGIRYGKGVWRGVSATRLFDAAATPVCSPRFLAATRVRVPADLATAALIREDRHDYWPLWLAAAGVSLASPPVGPQVRGELAIAAAEAGSGFALADAVQAGDALMAGRLVRPFEIAIEESAYFLVCADGARLTKAAQAFQAWLLGERDRFAARYAAWREVTRRTPAGRSARLP